MYPATQIKLFNIGIAYTCVVLLIQQTVVLYRLPHKKLRFELSMVSYFNIKPSDYVCHMEYRGVVRTRANRPEHALGAQWALEPENNNDIMCCT